MTGEAQSSVPGEADAPAGASKAAPAAPATPASAGSLARRLLPKLVLSILLGLAFLWLAQRGGVPLLPRAESMAKVAWWAVPAYLATLLVTHFLRGSRWRFLIAPYQKVSLKDSVLLNWIGFFAIFALPLRLGEFARPAICRMKLGTRMSVGLGTVAVERVIDGLVTSLCLVVALFAIPRRIPDDYLSRHLPYYGYLALAVFCAAFAAIGAFLWKRALARRLTERVVGIVSPTIGGRLASTVDGIAEGLRSLRDPRLAVPFVVETLGYWGTNAFGMWVLALGCGLEVSFAHSVAIMGVLAIGILLPAGPGMFGSFQTFVAAGLRLYVVDAVVADQGAAYVFILYVCQSLFMTVAGLVPLYALKLSIRDVLSPQGDPPPGTSVAPPPAV